ncbi:hypothetical protein [Xanthomonas arboricola]|uniref:hypothetical protein n=1 Tax=Xanthomonas arboricola TaxID=56448 RepID=UPI002B303645|nr:hypothetical protein X12_001739 [Xanthomonas arboricola]
MGFKDVKEKVIKDLVDGNYAHEARNNIDEKNLLLVGKISAAEVVEIIKKCGGNNYKSFPHYLDSQIKVHELKVRAWYVKFYFDPDTLFISVHKQEF